MGGTRSSLIVMVSALTVVLNGCTAVDTEPMSVEEYVMRECAITVDFKDRLGVLTRDFATKFKNRAALADTVQAMSDLYEEVLVKSEELGDPPNGEGTDDGGEVEQAARTLVVELDKAATDIRGATTDDEVQAAIGRMNDTILKSANIAAEFKKNQPTPELDELKKAHPGCSDEPV